MPPQASSSPSSATRSERPVELRRFTLASFAGLLAVLALSLGFTSAAAAKPKGLKPPSAVKVSRLTATTARVAWKDRSAERFFEVVAKPGARPAKSKRNTRSSEIAGLQPATKYKFKVRACTSKRKCSKFSKARRATTNAIPSTAPPFGFNDQLVIGDPGNGLLRSSGADFIRVPVAWSQMQPIAPPLGLPLLPPLPLQLNWGPMDAIAGELDRLGLKPLWVVSSAPCWAQNKGSNCPDELGTAPKAAFYDDYANFVLRIAQRYPGSIGIQVWNEPNIPKFWEPLPDSAEYRSLLRKTAKLVSDFGAKVPIVYGAPSPVTAADAKKDPTKIATTTFLKETLQGGVQGLDAVAVHPYSFNQPGDQTENSIRLFDQAAAVLKSVVPALPVWVTEIGFTTAGDFKVSPAQQAASLAALYEALVARGVKLISVHRFFDDASPPFKFEGGMGVVRSDRRTVKPAYCSLAVVRGNSPAPCD